MNQIECDPGGHDWGRYAVVYCDRCGLRVIGTVPLTDEQRPVFDAIVDEMARQAAENEPSDADGP
jgi:hypothetical protein